MNIENLSQKELLELAKSSSDSKILDFLSEHHDSNIRRVVAKNHSTSAKVIDRLSRDPVLNVSFVASQHSKCTTKRVFRDVSNPCVTCIKDESTMICVSCDSLQKYYSAQAS